MMFSVDEAIGTKIAEEFLTVVVMEYFCWY